MTNHRHDATALENRTGQDFCLVMAIWGEAYPDASVNVMLNAARGHSPGMKQVILFTDRHRPQIDPWVTQRPFPTFFDQPDFYGHGYRVKIGVFSSEDLPPATTCVYLDLDTLVTGDLGRIAALVKCPEDVFMLPPGNLIGFGPLRRAVNRWTQGRWYATGNSSVMAFHSSAKNDLARQFETCFRRGESGRHMTIDDVFISWAAQPNLQGIPSALAVSFRREFLARNAISLWLRRYLPFRRRHRDGIVAITFNGTSYKPQALLSLREGERISDAKGRFGYWSDAHIGKLRSQILSYCRAIVSSAPD
jgi:hypothetical protein